MFRHPNGELQKFVYYKTNRRELLMRGAAKISSFEFQYLHPPTLSYQINFP